MADLIDRPRGTRDFRPEETERRQGLLAAFRATAARFGYREIQTPTFEHLELFTRKSGPGVVDQLYAFQDKSDRQLALRPELTAPVVRFFVKELTMEPRPLKFYYYGPCFRYEEPQKGRYREFWQFGLELFGADGPEGDAEAVAVAYHCLRDADLDRFVLHVGHIGVLRGLVTHAVADDAARAETFRRIDKDDPGLVAFLAEAGVAARLAEAIAFIATHERRLVLGDEEGAPRAVQEYFEEALAAVRGAVPDALFAQTEADVARVQETLAALAAFGVTDVTMDLGVARGLDYYTGIVFEFEASDLGAEKQIGGGGAYTLSELLGGDPIATVGFGLGFDRILIALEKEGKAPQAAAHVTDAYFVPVSDAARVAAFETATRLRADGLNIEVDLMRRSMKKNMKRAGHVQARFAVILGDQELADGVATVRDMATGDQQTVKLTELAEALRR